MMTNLRDLYPALRRSPLYAADGPTVEQLQQQLLDATEKLKGFETAVVFKDQEELNRTIEDRLAKDRRSRGDGALTKQEKEELERHRKEKADADRKREEEKGNYDRVVKSLEDGIAEERKKWDGERTGLLGEIKKDRVIGSLIGALAKARAVNPEQIARLLDDRVTLDDHRQLVVLTKAGEPWLKGGKPATLEMLIEEHTKDNPWAYLAESDGRGSGSGGGDHTADRGGDLTGIDAEIAKAEEELKAVRERAQASGHEADITASRNAARKHAELVRKKKEGKR